MGKPADENLPEVVVNPTPAFTTMTTTTFDPSPEVLSPNDAATHTYYSERDKYPAQYDNAPKLPYDPNDGHMHTWPTAEPVSALSPNTTAAMPWESLPPADEANINNLKGGAKDEEKRICGIRRRTFIISVLVALVIIIAAAVGGGVGATRSKSGSETNSAAVESGVSSSISPTTTTSQSSTTSTTTSILPSQTIDFLNNETTIGLAFQGFSEPAYMGKNTSIIRKLGFYDFPFHVKSYVWLPDDSDCCLTFCANKTTSAGWWCDKRYRNETSDGIGFPRLHIWCDRANAEKYKTTCS